MISVSIIMRALRGEGVSPLFALYNADTGLLFLKRKGNTFRESGSQ